MKNLILASILACVLPGTAFAANLSCTSNLTNSSTALDVTLFKEEISDFRVDTRFVHSIPNTDFSYAVTTGLTKDITDDPEEPTYAGVPTLISLVVFNQSRSHVSRVDTPMREQVRSLNLIVGSEEENAKFRINISCVLL